MKAKGAAIIIGAISQAATVLVFEKQEKEWKGFDAFPRISIPPN